jgi:chromosome segregation ATPase
MNNIETLLSQKQARQRLVQSQMRVLQEEYIPLRLEKEELEEEIEQLEEELQKIDNVQTDARFDELIKDIEVEKSFNNMMGNPLEELDQLIDEIKNPEDYANFDLKDLESSQ